MRNNDGSQFADRLDALETALSEARAEIATLRRRGGGMQRVLCGSAIALTVVAIGTALQAARTEAQAPAGSKVEAPFEVVDDNGATVFRVADDGWTLFSEGKALVGATLEEGKGSLMVGHLVKPGNFAQLSFTDDGTAEVQLITATRKVASLTATKEDGAELKLFVAGQEEAALELGFDDDTANARFQIRNAEGETAAMVSAGDSGGTMRVFNNEGMAVGGLFARASGGGVALTGAAGGRSAVSLSVSEAGGRVQVAPAAGGSFHAELGAYENGGGVTVYTPAGEPAALLYARESGAGQLEINQNGNKLVEAGVTMSGLGVVLAGPGGRASSIPGVPDSYIMGRNIE